MTGFDLEVPFSLGWNLKFTPANVANPQFTADGTLSFVAKKRVPGLPISIPANGVKEIDFVGMGFSVTDFILVQTATQGKTMGIKFDNSADVINFKPLALDNRAMFMGSASLSKITVVNTDLANPLDIIVVAVQG